jgi:DNA repair exonuclease SbcCD ATPase subunit
MGEIKQANFRIDTETAAQFREFCEANGLNQAQGFDHIMQVAEMDKAKTTLPKRATEIEEFERHTKNLITAYLNSLEIAESTEERLLEQFQSRLESKDEQIMKLQAEVKAKEELATMANTSAMEAENKAEVAEQASADAKERAKTAEQMAKDKEEIANMLNVENIKLKAQLDGYDELRESETSLKAQLAESLQNIKEMQREAEIAQERAVAAMQKEIDRASAEHEKAIMELQAEKDRAVASAELAGERAVAAAEKSHQEVLQRMYDKIEKVQDEKSDLKDAMSSVKQKNRELQAELEALKAENERLRNGKN